jgi:hypothetical protein
MTARKTARLTQETFEMHAALAVRMHERYDEVMEEKRKLQSKVCDTLAEAMVLYELETEKDEILEEYRRIATELEALGMPMRVWVRYRREDAKDMRIQVRPGTASTLSNSDQRPFLGVDPI